MSKTYFVCATPRSKSTLLCEALKANEMRNLVGDPRLSDIAGDLRERLQRWMVEDRRPVGDGPVPLPPGPGREGGGVG
jgi:LPS sulfotransferase NodH